ncbi:MAG: PaaI family thioesterase [Elusimicrobiaceae bacterium]|nr:PaaI family thioesterase [Elusimicrobiaceae bacterium]
MADIATLNRIQAKLHDTCIVCGGKNPVGLKLRFELLADSSLKAEFMGKFMFEGYKGCLHGGVIAALMDSAMTNCLFAHNIAAFTAELAIKYKKPVRCGKKVVVTARIVKSCAPLHLLEAQLMQDDNTVVSAAAKFMENELLGK